MSEAAESAVSGDMYTDETLQAFAALFGTPVEDENDTAWMESALCSQTDPHIFFPEKGENSREAKKTCFACPVRGDCEEYILTRLANGYKEYGIWAGLSVEQREKRLKERGITVSRSTRNTHLDAEMVTARRLGVPVDVVAARAGVSPRTVERAVARNRQVA